MKKLIGLLFVLLGILIFLSYPNKIKADEETISTTTPELVKTFESEVSRLALKYGQSEILALKIMWCEGQHYSASVNRNYHYVANGVDPSGKIYYKKVLWSSDWGHWQINDYYHLRAAKKMGLDIKDEWDNLEYGFWLLDQQGTRPWNASKYCWENALGVDT